MNDDFKDNITNYISEQLRQESNIIIQELADIYYDRISQCRNKLISNILDSIEVNFIKTHSGELDKLQIEIINKYKKEE